MELPFRVFSSCIEYLVETVEKLTPLLSYAIGNYPKRNLPNYEYNSNDEPTWNVHHY
jgi:hypothetical protein